MTDEERAIKHSFTITVPAYIVAPEIPGVPNGVRRTLSATQFSFGIIDGMSDVENPGNVTDMRIDSRVLDAIATVDDPAALGSIGSSAAAQAERQAGGAQRRGTAATPSLSTAVGGTESSSLTTRSITRRVTEDPITGKAMDVTIRARRVSSAHGEEVFTTVVKTSKSDKDLK
jgi:hypothetical protein